MFKLFSLLALCCLISFSNGHSQMRCFDWDANSRTCRVPIRNQAQQWLQESYVWTSGANICQNPYRNPISSYYANGAGCPSWAGCPTPMGTVTTGQTVNIMWLARNHAIANQDPRNVIVYVSPKQTSTQTSDPTVSQLTQICQGAYMNCPSGNGPEKECYLQCTIPSTLDSGTYTFWWKWDWTHNDGKIYATCADVNVVKGSGSSSSGSTSSSSSSSGSASSTSSSTSSTSGNSTNNATSTTRGSTTRDATSSTTQDSTTRESTTRDATSSTTRDATASTTRGSTTRGSSGSTTRGSTTRGSGTSRGTTTRGNTGRWSTSSSSSTSSRSSDRYPSADSGNEEDSLNQNSTVSDTHEDDGMYSDSNRIVLAGWIVTMLVVFMLV